MAEEVVTTTAEAPEDYKEYLKWQASEKTAPAVQRDEKGKFVSTQPKAQESVPADAPEKTVEPEAKAETAPESGTGEEPQELEESVGKEAQKRIRQLLARVKELESKSDVKAESSPAADVKKAEPSPAKPRLTRPQWSTWDKGPEEFDQAQSAYEEQLRQDIAQEVMNKVAYEQTQRDIIETEKELPGFQKSIDLVISEIGGKPECGQIAYILGSGPGWKGVTHYLGHNPELLQSLAKLAKSDPVEAICEAVRIRDKVLNKPAEKAEVAPEPKPVVQTKAPKPIAPINKSAPTDNGLHDDLEWKEWRKRREAQLRS
jgi:hypothetical protein